MSTRVGFERFTDGGQIVWKRSVQEALSLGHSYVGTEHILLALLRDDGIAGRVLSNLDRDVIRGAVIRQLAQRQVKPAVEKRIGELEQALRSLRQEMDGEAA